MGLIEWGGVAIGGALGACTRFFLTNRINTRWRNSFPLATFLINITGAFLLGYIYAVARPHNVLDAWLRSGVGVGFIGTYTTFSTFMFEGATLRDRRATRVLFLYFASSAAVGLLAAWLGSLL